MTNSTDISKLKFVCDEIIGEDRLQEFLKTGDEVKHYIGFETSGVLHLGHGIMVMKVIKELQDLGVKCHMFMADWHAWINDKLGGDLAFMQSTAIPLFREMFHAAANVVGVDFDKLVFMNASQNVNDSNYWATVIDVARNTTLARVQRSIDIMGRKEGETADFAKLIYPAMQAADVFYMGMHIAHGGTDQRKAYVISIDVADHLKFSPLMLGGKRVKPVVICSHFLQGLTPPPKEMVEKEKLTYEEMADIKMSKSKPLSAIYLDDSEEMIREKIKKAYCPEGIVRLNPILDWSKHICLALGNKKLEIKRKAEWGGDVTYSSYEVLEADFVAKKLHPMDLKDAVVRSLIEILKPAREYLSNPEIKRMQQEVAKKVTR
ncbi:MAG: tyrosine--tRNA ligase [Patescibacteria group bacterium]